MANEQTFYNEFNTFQADFFTSIERFQKYTDYDCKKYGYVLINNIAKGFPNLADIISNLKGLNWSGISSPNLLRALQHNFVNSHVVIRVPQFVYFKNLKPEKDTAKVKISKKSKDLLEFDADTQNQIMSILMIDTKTYHDLRYSQKVQDLGRQITGQFFQAEKMKKSRKSSKKDSFSILDL